MQTDPSCVRCAAQFPVMITATTWRPGTLRYLEDAPPKIRAAAYPDRPHPGPGELYLCGLCYWKIQYSLTS